MGYTSESTLDTAIKNLKGSAGHLLKIWFTLKHMGLKPGAKPVGITTSNSTAHLKKLFGYGSPTEDFFVPFAHTERFMTMKHDAARSVIQTTLQRWGTSNSVVTCDPTAFLSIEAASDGLKINTKSRYPAGLGWGASGFAIRDEERVAIPIYSFSIWYGRQHEIPPNTNELEHLKDQMLKELNISQEEQAVIFVKEERPEWEGSDTALTDEQIYRICQSAISFTGHDIEYQLKEGKDSYIKRLTQMVGDPSEKNWLKYDPDEETRILIESGIKSILLYGPPRTGKTNCIEKLFPRENSQRTTIQIHDGWTYENLIEGLRPKSDGSWGWELGILAQAIEAQNSCIILEEVNRTNIMQAMGEVFSLLEQSYRGEKFGLQLASGKRLSLPEETIIVMTMNTIDKSTERIDDALIGRLAAIEYKPRASTLRSMLEKRNIKHSLTDNILEFFTEIQNFYPLGHGYFSGITSDYTKQDITRYYRSFIRPVLYSHFGEVRKEEMDSIDSSFERLVLDANN